jgi:hypothetical protein
MNARALAAGVLIHFQIKKASYPFASWLAGGLAGIALFLAITRQGTIQLFIRFQFQLTN